MGLYVELIPLPSEKLSVALPLSSTEQLWLKAVKNIFIQNATLLPPLDEVDLLRQSALEGARGHHATGWSSRHDISRRQLLDLSPWVKILC